MIKTILKVFGVLAGLAAVIYIAAAVVVKTWNPVKIYYEIKAQIEAAATSDKLDMPDTNEPSDPTEPSIPTTPTEPTEPGEPSTPTIPEEPEQPIKPEESVEFEKEFAELPDALKSGCEIFFSDLGYASVDVLDIEAKLKRSESSEIEGITLEFIYLKIQVKSEYDYLYKILRIEAFDFEGKEVALERLNGGDIYYITSNQQLDITIYIIPIDM